MYARIPYLDGREPDHVAVTGDLDDLHLSEVITFTIDSYAGVLDLAPGDRLVVTDIVDGVPILTDVHTLRPCWLIELQGRTPNMLAAPGEIDIQGLDDWNWEAAKLTFEEVATAVADRVDCDRQTNYSLSFATEDRTLMQQLIATPGVGAFAIRREPDQRIDFAKQRRERGLLDYPTHELA